MIFMALTSELIVPWLFQEIDYTKEAANAEQFAENFKDMDYVKVPSVYWEYTTPQVSLMSTLSICLQNIYRYIVIGLVSLIIILD